MASRAYHVVFRNFYPEKVCPRISRRSSRVRLPFQFLLQRCRRHAPAGSARINFAPDCKRSTALSRIGRFTHRRICSQIPTKICSMKSSRFSSSAFITNSNIRNCSSRTSSMSSRKTRSILFFELVRDGALRCRDHSEFALPLHRFRRNSDRDRPRWRRIRLRQRRAPPSSAGSRVFTGNPASHKWRIYRVHRRQRLQPAGILVIARLDDRERTTLERAALLDKTRRRLVEFHALRSSSRR